MKKQLFRITAFLMVCCLLFAGCTTTENGDSTTKSTTTTSTEAPTSTDGTTSSTDSTAESNTTASTGDTTVTTKPTTSKTTKSTTSKATTSTTTTTTKSTLSAAQLKKYRDQVGFGYYRMGALPFVALPAIEKEVSKGHINFWATSFGRASTYLAKADEMGDKYLLWIDIFDIIFAYSSNGSFLNYGWENKVREGMQAIEDEGLMEHVWGFYFDEPLTTSAMKREDFIKVTKFLRDTYPDLRVFAVFQVREIDPSIMGYPDNGTVIDEATTKYLTDIGYDMYADAKQDLEKFEKLNTALKTRLGNNNPRIWYVPCTMSYHGTTDEQYAIDHLEMCFNFLKEEKNPGGLYCYAYDITNRDGDFGNIGLSEKQAEWTRLEKRLVEIGKEIRSWNK